VDVLDGVYYNIYTDNVYKNGPLVLMTAPTEHICSKKRTIRDNVIHDIEPVNRIFTKAYICSNTISNFWILAETEDLVACPTMLPRHGYKISIQEYLARINEAESQVLRVLGYVHIMNLHPELKMNQIIENLDNFPKYLKSFYY
jgi:hypothetical protein